MDDTTPQHLTTTDAAWLRVEDRSNLSICSLVLTFERALDFERLKARIEDHLMAIERFRQRVEPSRLPWSRPRWQEDDEFSLGNHLFRHQTADDALETLLLRHTAALIGTSLDAAHPLWQIHLVEGSARRSALIVRVHQAIADCTAVPQLITVLADPESHPERPIRFGPPDLVSTSEVLAAARQSGAPTRLLCRLITTRSDSDSPLKGQPAAAKTVAWSRGVSLDRIESHARELGCSVEEILLTAVVAALRSELHYRDTPVEGLRLRAAVPLSLRQKAGSATGTLMAFASVSLPLDPASAADRLAAVQAELRRGRGAMTQLIVLGAEPGRGLTMSEIEERSLLLVGTKATLLLSLIEGPSESLAVCGVPVARLMVWPALSGNLGLGVSVVRYAGLATAGVVADERMIGSAGVHRIAAGIADALAVPAP